jgi:hypothetical protein
VTHLGERVSALVDGQLPVDATERAHAHLANCRDCRDAVEAERLMKARLRCLPDLGPGADFVSRLLAMGGPAGPLPPRPGHVPGTPRPEPVLLAATVGPDLDLDVDLEPLAGELVGATSGAVAGTISGAVSGVVIVATSAAGRDTAVRGGTALAAGPGRPVPGRAATARWVSVRPGPSRPAGRSVGRRRARLAGAVLGALGVVGAGVGGLVLATPSASGGSVGPVQAPLDSFVVRRAAPAPTGFSADVSLQLRPGRSFAPASVPSSTAGR